jgi:NAD-dependent dihydropyrimidine dehydrogenase PreA subunit
VTKYRVQVDAEKCIGCAQCYVACANKVFAIINKKSVPKNPDACVGCRACVVKCPTNAITVMPRDIYAAYARFYGS